MRRSLSWLAGIASVLVLLSFARTAVAEEDEPYFMADVQATVNLPPRWNMSRWSDWDFKAESRDRAVMMWLFMTPYQITPTEEAAKKWAELHEARLVDNQAGAISLDRVEITEVAGRPTAELDYSFRFNGDGPRGVYRAMVFAADSKNIHISTLAAARRAGRAEDAVRFITENLEVDRPAVDLQKLSGRAVSPAEFEALLPEGWRLPTPNETVKVTARASALGEESIDTEKCWVAIQPLVEREPDLMLFCQRGWYLDPVDEHSWEGISELVRQKFFGSNPAQVEKVEVANRLGFLYIPDMPAGAVRMAVLPYNQGIVHGWGLAEKDREEQLGEDFRAVVNSLQFTGPGNGQPHIGFAQWLSYAIKYRRTDPVVLVPAIAIVGLFTFLLVALARRRTPNYEDLA